MRALPQLGFVEAVKLASSRILDFKGRSRRSEFWWWILIVLVANWTLTSFVSDLLISSIIATIVMFFGLAVTARRLQDADKSAWWVYISYALGIISNIYTATSPAIKNLMEDATNGSFDPDNVIKVWGHNAGELLFLSGVSILFAIFALIVFIMCLKDSEPQTTEHGDSPKYVNE
jgi:uncharacterized membrane protein YhaH (DUF805 family)